MITFQVLDMTCGRCAGTISRAIAAVDETARVNVSIADKLIRIDGSATAQEYAEAITEAGYTPQAVEAKAAPVRQAAGGCCCGSRKAATA